MRPNKNGTVVSLYPRRIPCIGAVNASANWKNKAKTKKFYSTGDLVATRTMDEKGTTDDVTNLPLAT